MEDGEFKKRLTQLRRDYVETTYLDYDLKIIEQAKKDFPKKKPMYDDWDEKNPDDFDYDKIEVDRWLKKWFGSVDAPKGGSD